MKYTIIGLTIIAVTTIAVVSLAYLTGSLVCWVLTRPAAGWFERVMFGISGWVVAAIVLMAANEVGQAVSGE